MFRAGIKVYGHQICHVFGMSIFLFSSSNCGSAEHENLFIYQFVDKLGQSNGSLRHLKRDSKPAKCHPVI
jgi:hypothetical protein